MKGGTEPVLRRLNGGIASALRSRDAGGQGEQLGFQLAGTTPPEFAAQIKRDIELVGRIVKAAGIKAAG